MYEIAEQVALWLAEGRAVQVAQLVATRGFSSRDTLAALAWTADGAAAGGLLPAVDAQLMAETGAPGVRLAEVAVSDGDAVAAGLSCGGTATVLVQDAAAMPPAMWDRLVRREPLCLVTEVEPGTPARTEVYVRSDVSDARPAGGIDVARTFARGVSTAALDVAGTTSVVVVTLWPPTTLLVIGDGSIAAALASAGALLGWTVRVTGDVSAAVGLAGSLTESDAALVLSHDRAVDVPALAALLNARAGYVGALGSRATQAARRDALRGRGLTDDGLARIYGPAGLDIDAHTPGEIAVSIVAEVLAVRSGRSGGLLSRRSGPVHTAGVHAPPPRYPA